MNKSLICDKKHSYSVFGGIIKKISMVWWLIGIKRQFNSRNSERRPHIPVNYFRSFKSVRLIKEILKRNSGLFKRIN